MVALTVHDAVTLGGSPVYVPDHGAAGDGDTTTYIEVAVGGSIAAVPFDLPSTDYSSITFTALVSRTLSSRTRFTWDIADANGSAGGIGSNVEVGATITITEAPGTLQTITRTFDDAYFAPGGMGETDDFVNPAGMTLQEWLTGLIAFPPGPRLVLSSSLRTVRIHEVTLSGVPLATGSFPLRRYPPANNGGHGPTRHWPRSVNRRAGGTY